MSKLEVLVACMHQKDDALYREMNLETDAVFANQCGEYSYREYAQDNGCTAKLVSTQDRGVGRNRNKALSWCSGEYLLFSDQDVIYFDGYSRVIEEAFERYPKADMLFFNLEYIETDSGIYKRKQNIKYRRVHLWNSMRYGAPRIAIKRTSLEKACLGFSVLYGGGAPYSAGEDALFVRDAMRKGLRAYSVPIAIAKVKQDESTWFKGYTEKYFIDKGIWLANAFPVLKHVFMYYFAYGMRNYSKEYGFFEICRLMRKGYREFKRL